MANNKTLEQAGAEAERLLADMRSPSEKIFSKMQFNKEDVKAAVKRRRREELEKGPKGLGIGTSKQIIDLEKEGY